MDACLKESRANLDTLDANGKSSLYVAAEHGHIQVWDLRIWISGSGVLCVGFIGYSVTALGLGAWGFGFRISSFGFRVSGFGFRVSGFGLGFEGLGFLVCRSRAWVFS